MAKKITSPAFRRKEKTTEQTLDELLNRGKKSSSRYLFGESVDPITLEQTPQSALAAGNVQGANVSSTGYAPQQNSDYSIYQYPSAYSDFDPVFNRNPNWLQEYMDTFGIYGDEQSANPYEVPGGVTGENQVTEELANRIYQQYGLTYATGQENNYGYVQNDGSVVSYDGKTRYDQNGAKIEKDPDFQRVGVDNNPAPTYISSDWENRIRQEEQNFYEFEQRVKEIEATDPERAQRAREKAKIARDFFYNTIVPGLQKLQAYEPYFEGVDKALEQSKQLLGLYQEQSGLIDKKYDTIDRYDQKWRESSKNTVNRIKQKQAADPNSLEAWEKILLKADEISNDQTRQEELRATLEGTLSPGEMAMKNIEYSNYVPPENARFAPTTETAKPANKFMYQENNFVVPKYQNMTETQSLIPEKEQTIGQKVSSAIEKAQPTGTKFDLGISEALRGDITGAKNVLGSTVSTGLNKAKDVLQGINIFNPPQAQASEPQAGGGLKQQIQEAQSYYQGGGKQDLTTPFVQKAVGGSPSGTQELAKSSYSPTTQLSAVSNPQDPFFKAGGAERYAGMINVGSDYRGALTPALFKNAFYESASNVRDVFGGTAYEGEAAGKARQAEASKYNFSPDQWAYQNKADYRRDVDEYNSKLNAYLNQVESSAKGQGGDYQTLARASSSLQTPFAVKEDLAQNAFYSSANKPKTYADLAGTKETFSAFKPVSTANASAPQVSRPDYANYVSLSDYLRQGKTAQQYYAETGQQGYLDQLGRSGITMDTQGNLSGVGINNGSQPGDVSWGQVSTPNLGGQSIPTTRYTNPSSTVARAQQDAAIAWNPNTQQKSISQRAREEAARKWRTY